MEKVIDGNLVALEVKNITKKLKVNEFMALLAYTFKKLEENGTVKLDDQAYNNLITYLSLTLIARVNSKKDFENILAKCQVEEKEQA